ncbi:MAG: hypothetical protein Rpha_0704 [Candidatus Ruthia sp. Apha_13_S6]|nr:hypothetical protein [Candidatus Ruthia sp. Apha_13_S6]
MPKTPLIHAPKIEKICSGSAAPLNLYGNEPKKHMMPIKQLTS